MSKKINEWELLDIIFGSLGLGAVTILCLIAYQVFK
jgi:hypothetical protein